MRSIPACLFALLALTSSCDNVGRAFDPIVTPPPGPTPTTTSNIQVPPVGGDVRDGRPVVRATYPKAGGWPTTVPVVVEFSESVNEASILPTSQAAGDAKVILRLAGTNVALPVVYNFLANGRLLVMTPVQALQNAPNTSYEVVMLPGGRDADGVRFQVNTEDLLATFTVDEAATETDGRILALYPRDNQRDIARETDLVAIFTRVANPALPVVATQVLPTGSFVVRTSGGTPVAGELTAPLGANLHVVQFHPTTPFTGSTTFELVVTSGITFGSSGQLNFNGRSPFARFTTASITAPTAVRVGNATSGFPDCVNRQNTANATVEVDVPADALVGDRVVARVYGGDHSTTATGDLLMTERSVVLATAGTQPPVAIDFSGAFGTVDRIRLDEGAITFTAQMQRGSVHSGIVHDANDALFDVTAPEVQSLGPPAATSGNVLFTELQEAAIQGRASEQIARANLAVGASNLSLFASGANGNFLMEPFALGRSIAPVAFNLTVTDRAGNPSAGATAGSFVQRGFVTGSGAAGDVTVDVYDDATLRGVAGARVLVDAPVPTTNGAGQVEATTDAAGRATFTGLPATNHTITVVADGYHVITLYDTPAGDVSLPLRPRTNATAALAGNVDFDNQNGNIAVVGCNLVDDATLPPIPLQASVLAAVIRPNRPAVVSVVAGPALPTSTPAFRQIACNLCGVDLTTPTPPPTPPAGGGRLLVNIEAAAANGLPEPPGSLGEDFASAVGLATGSLVGPPATWFAMSLQGIPGQVLFGRGFTTLVSGASFSINGSYSRDMSDALAAFAGENWIVTQAIDSGGRTSRHRSRLVFGTSTTVVDDFSPQAIPQVSTTGTVTGPPQIDFFDAMDLTLPEAAGYLGLNELICQDTTGRQWRLLTEDADDMPSPARPRQFPFTGATPALADGAWTVACESRMFRRSGAGVGDLVLGERFHLETLFSRSAVATVTVQ